jgi:AraC family transcriptional activator of pobA
MKKGEHSPVKISTISELHRYLGLPGPVHPLISLVDNTLLKVNADQLPGSFLFGFYKISYKKAARGKMGYGQGYYDFDEGGMVYTAPNQLIALNADVEYSGCSLFVHPDFLRNHHLGKNISKYGFFAYETHEALHLSEKEKTVMLNVLNQIGDELNTAIDDFSQDVVLSYLEVLLNYSNRFYKRQFITRKAVNHHLLEQLEQVLNQYFEQQDTLKQGLPTVDYLAGKLNFSARYLSDMLRSLTGQSAQQHIHEKLIEKAKEYLTATHLSVAEIAYQLGFEHPQSFNKLFKQKTSLSPLAFKQSFN